MYVKVKYYEICKETYVFFVFQKKCRVSLPSFRFQKSLLRSHLPQSREPRKRSLYFGGTGTVLLISSPFSIPLKRAIDLFSIDWMKWMFQLDIIEYYPIVLNLSVAVHSPFAKALICCLCPLSK